MAFDRAAWHAAYVQQDRTKKLLRDAAARYRRSENGRAYFDRYDKGVARKESAKRYIKTPRGQAIRKRHYDGYKTSQHGQYVVARCSARRGNKVWGISENEYTKLRNQMCFYCGGALNPTGVGLDRLDNTRGYTPDNVVPCCGDCNILRGDRLTPQETVVAMEAVLKLRADRAGAANGI